MRIVVDKTKCTGHGRCNAASEELYKLDELGYAAFEMRDVPADLVGEAEKGANDCPEGAIRLV